MATTKAPRETPTIREFFIEPDGLNKVIMYQYEKTTELFIKLKAEDGRKRRIGVITKSTKTLRIKRDREKHLFRKLTAYGFNDYVLRTGQSFDKISLKDDIAEWKIPVSFILENGKDKDGCRFLWYKTTPVR